MSSSLTTLYKTLNKQPYSTLKTLTSINKSSSDKFSTVFTLHKKIYTKMYDYNRL